MQPPSERDIEKLRTMVGGEDRIVHIVPDEWLELDGKVRCERQSKSS